ncbi:hypothetical protein PQZ09_01970 [Methylophilaceae bacterium]|nr:hypothetical protein [Methylophilaceae bacterium]
MKKLLILLFSLLISFNSYGEWTLISKTSEGQWKGAAFYLDIDSIKKKNGNIYFWVLSDYPFANEFGYLSYRMFSEGDCSLMREKKLQRLFYFKQMGKGDYVLDKEKSEWQYLPPNSVGHHLMQTACDASR